MSSINKTILLGRVGKDPDIRRTQSGDAIANFSIATSERWKDKNTGERKEKTDWHNCVAFGPLAGIVEQYVKKGSQLYVEGKLQTRKWQDQSGNDRYSTEVVLQGFGAQLVMLDGKPSGERETRQESYELDDDIPF